ncbi:MAG TPA: ACT domain-containing protein [Candidatus Binatia bacterium]|nr:ACT domain-containing protein [Candidatus Binatia bacterium]
MPVETDLLILIEDRPGIAARAGDALGRAGINIEGVCGIAHGGQGILHILVPDERSRAARAALEEARLTVAGERDVWVMECADRPGELGRVMRLLADEGISTDLVYLTTAGKLVIGANEFGRIRAVLG